MLSIDEAKVGITGLGYVGLPLAVEFGKVMPTVGYDINTARIDELRSGKDSTLEVDAAVSELLIDERGMRIELGAISRQSRPE